MMDNELPPIIHNIELIKATQHTLSEELSSLGLKTQSLTNGNQLILSEIEIQSKKTKALLLLSSELQKKLHCSLFQTESFGSNPKTIAEEKEMVKQLLVRQGEEIEVYKQLNHFLKQYTLNHSKELFDSFINKQSELSAKAQSKLLEFKNPGLGCKRRWAALGEENQELVNRAKTLKQQLLRQQANIKDRYQQYFNQINKYNAQLVYLNTCQDEKVISQHLIEEMSLVQAARKDIEDEYNELRADYKEILQHYQQAQENKKVILNFFSNTNEETKLCNSIRQRVGELADLVHDLKLHSINPKIATTSNVIESIKDHHKRLKDKLEFLKSKYQGNFDGKASVEEVEVADFFNKLFVDKDEKMDVRAKLNHQLTQKVQNLINAKVALEQRCRIIKESIDNGVVFETQHRRGGGENKSQQLRTFTFNKDQSLYP